MHAYMHTYHSVCGGQRSTFGSQFSPFILASEDQILVARFVWQALLSAEPSHQLMVFIFKVLKLSLEEFILIAHIVLSGKHDI